MTARTRPVAGFLTWKVVSPVVAEDATHLFPIRAAGFSREGSESPLARHCATPSALMPES